MKTDRKTYWLIVACNDGGWWILNRFHYSGDNLNGALKEASGFASGEYPLADPGASITVVES